MIARLLHGLLAIAVLVTPVGGTAQELVRPLVALLAPMSGDDASFGRRVARAVQFPIGTRAAVRVEVFDAGEDPAAAYAEAVEAGAVAIIGPVHAWRTEAVLQARRDDDPPLFVLSSVDGVESAAQGVFRMRTSPGDQAEALVGVVLADANAPLRIAIFAPDDSYGQEALQAFVAGAAAWGGVVDRVVRYPVDPDEDLTPFVAALAGQRRVELVVPVDPWRTAPRSRDRNGAGLRERPDALFLPDYADRVADIAPFLAFHEWRGGAVSDDVALLGLSGWVGPELEWVGDLVAGATLTQVWDPQDMRPAAEAFSLEFRVRYADEPTAFDAQLADAAAFVAAAVEQAGAPWSADIVRAAALALERPGACGTMRLDAEGGVERELGLWQVDGSGNRYPLGVIERAP